ncbi:MAG TPA: RluA family pseudouridine synthase [Chloroflexota bacterium]|nr:RluA family pseudouridine synthase [Chloroflexota bacterium]
MPPGRAVTFDVPLQLAGERLDRVVTALHPELSRAAISTLIADGRVSVNGRPCKAATRPVAGARVTLDLPPTEPLTTEAEAIPLEVIFEDDALVVIDKPAGMVVHPAPGNLHGTLVNALLARYADLPGEPFRPGIVHRLDKDTSGLIVVARTAPALAALASAFKQRDVYKEYLALVVGHPNPASGAISGDIGRDPRRRQRMAVVAVGGREAHTTYETVEVLGGYALLRVVLGTGRTHQIRVHLGAMGYPIAGDPVYGRPAPALGLHRQFLHAARLRFRHPFTGEELDLRADPPSDLQSVLETLRQRR